MSDFIQNQLRSYDERLAVIEEQLAGHEELVHERERLLAARRALGGGSATREQDSPGSAPAPSTRRTRRGESRERVRAVVLERPGVTPAEISAAAGLAANTVYSVLRAMQARGEVERIGLPGQRSGYRVPGPQRSEQHDGSQKSADEDGGQEA